MHRPRHQCEDQDGQDLGRRAQAQRIQGTMLALEGGLLSDREGNAGIWDILKKYLGIRNLSRANKSPWLLAHAYLL